MHYYTNNLKPFSSLQAPCNDASRYASSREDFSDLLFELSKSLRPHGLELSAMVASSPRIASLAYNPNVLMTELDWVAIAANDYSASSTGRTAYLVPLESSEVAGVNSFVSLLIEINKPHHEAYKVQTYSKRNMRCMYVKIELDVKKIFPHFWHTAKPTQKQFFLKTDRILFVILTNRIIKKLVT